MTGDSTQSKWNMTMNGLHGGGVTGLVSTQPNQPSVRQCICLMLCGRGVGWDYLEDACDYVQKGVDVEDDCLKLFGVIVLNRPRRRCCCRRRCRR
eukprot:2060161-Pleurochrysis_carterae.AAC.1